MAFIKRIPMEVRTQRNIDQIIVGAKMLGAKVNRDQVGWIISTYLEGINHETLFLASDKAWDNPRWRADATQIMLLLQQLADQANSVREDR